MYYYGARYYDAKLSRWISADPILSAYLDGKPNGGIYNPKVLNMYSYVSNNPIIFVDPTGMFERKSVDVTVDSYKNLKSEDGISKIQLQKQHFKADAVVVNDKHDTLWSIAVDSLKKNGEKLNEKTINKKIEDIKTMNKLDSDVIKKGQIIVTKLSFSYTEDGPIIKDGMKTIYPEFWLIGAAKVGQVGTKIARAAYANWPTILMYFGVAEVAVTNSQGYQKATCFLIQNAGPIMNGVEFSMGYIDKNPSSSQYGQLGALTNFLVDKAISIISGKEN